jgi:hypothetical protein
MTTPPLTNPLLNPQVIAQMAQGAAQQAPPLIKPPVMGTQAPPPIKAPTAGDTPPPMMAPGQGMTGAPPALAAPQSPNVTTKPTQMQIDKDELARKINTGSGISQIAGKVEGAMPNHPLIGKLLGGAAQGIATLGDAGLRTVAPGLDEALPGTSLHHQAQVNQGNRQVAADEGNAEKEGQTANLGAETAGKQLENANEPRKAEDAHNLVEAQTGNVLSETSERDHPKPSLEVHDTEEGPILINRATGAAQHVSVDGQPVGPKIKLTESQPIMGADGKPHTYMLDEKGNKKVDLGVHYEKPVAGTSNVGTWQVEESPDGKPMLFNSKTAQTQAGPEGMQKAGTKAKADAALKPVQDALNYADEYAKRTVHTGPGDEAMMEKFFELAKPSTGFRMSQPQIDMLRNAQSWMSGVEAHLRHATTGTWFSDQQRQEIANTMGDLGRSKGITAEGAGGGQTGGPPPGASQVGHDAKGNVVGWVVNGKWQNAGGQQ